MGRAFAGKPSAQLGLGGAIGERIAALAVMALTGLLFFVRLGSRLVVVGGALGRGRAGDDADIELLLANHQWTSLL